MRAHPGALGIGSGNFARNRPMNNRPDPAGVAGVCFALAGVIAIITLIAIITQVVELLKKF